MNTVRALFARKWRKACLVAATSRPSRRTGMHSTSRTKYRQKGSSAYSLAIMNEILRFWQAAQTNSGSAVQV
jgi:hypothetical protein